MTQEDKNLLLQDLCARLPYGVRGERIWTAPVSGSPEKGIYVFDTFDIKVLTTGYYDCGEHGFREVRDYSFKPYLFPMSSMTEEQKKEFKEISKCKYEIGDYGGFDSEGVYLIEIGRYEYEHDINTTFEEFYFNHEIIDWLNKNHFDYRGLIEKGLAISAIGLNIY